MKKYLVTEAEIVKALWAPGEMMGIELPPNARLLTREQVHKKFNGYLCALRLKEFLDELFGEEG